MQAADHRARLTEKELTIEELRAKIVRLWILLGAASQTTREGWALTVKDLPANEPVAFVGPAPWVAIPEAALSGLRGGGDEAANVGQSSDIETGGGIVVADGGENPSMAADADLGPDGADRKYLGESEEYSRQFSLFDFS